MAVDRRSVLKFIVGGAVGTLLTPIPWKSADDIAIWTQNWPWIPRIPDGKLGTQPSLVKMGGTEYGITVQTVDGQPITVAGNPEHGLSMGSMDPLAAAGVQMMYSPSRIPGPLQRKNTGFDAISWSQARKILLEKLQNVQNKSNKLACISGERTSSCNEILAAFTSRMDSEHFYLMPGDDCTIQQVWQKLFLGGGSLGFDLENSDFLFILGPDLFESWGTYVRNQKILGQNQPRTVYAGPVQNNTAALAGEWVPVKTDQMGLLALGVAYHILDMGDPKLWGVRGAGEFKDFIRQEFGPQKLRDTLDVSENKLRALAKMLLQARRPLVIPGTVSGQGGSRFDIYAALTLNVLLDRINQTGGLKSLPEAPRVIEDAPARDSLLLRDLVGTLQAWMEQKQEPPELLLIYEANPAYALPGLNMQQSLANIPFKVCFNTFMDETAAQCDLILPNPYFLERLEDSYTPFGSGQANYSLADKVQAPWKDCKPTADLILDLAKALDLQLGFETYEDLLQAKAEILDADWSGLTRGGFWTKNTVKRQTNLTLWNQQIQELAEARTSSESRNFPLRLAATHKLKSGTDQIAIPPFGLKTLLENELQGEMFFVRICRKTAGKYNLQQGDRIRLESPVGQCVARVELDEGIMPGVVDAPLGFGRSNWDEFSENKGDNVYKLFNASREQDSTGAAWADTRLQIVKL